ncbi:unnamed protein product [Amaranthus hypochondriacus]
MKQNPNTNPNSRINQEKEGVGVRKSFQGYPFSKSSITALPRSLIPNTLANSPAEYARKSSVDRECGIHFQDNEQKENDSDLNQKTGLRVRPPFIAKGTKNFMSPTISAVSKINPSPRKKVLGERNESIRTSASLSEGKFHFFSDNLSEFDDENEPKENLVTPPCYKISDSNKESVEKAADLDTDLVLSPELPLYATKSSDTLPLDDMSRVVCDETLGLDVKNTDCSSPSITPIHGDADPSSLPPYDPKTNLLSPRPQFLYYKPNPRIENYINQGIKFEDDFTSDSVSETESSEEVQSQASSSVGTSCLEEKSSSFELTSQEVEELEELDKPKIEARLWFGAKWKVVTLILLMLLGGMSLSWFYPGVRNAVYHEVTNSQFYRNPSLAAKVSRENLNGVCQNIKVWSAQYVGYSYSSQMFTKKRVVKFSPLPVNNFTVWQEQEVEDYLVKDHFQLRPLFDSYEELQSSPSKPSEESKVDDYAYAAEKVEQTSGSLLPSSDLTEHIETEEQDQGSTVEDYMIEEFEREILRESDVIEEGVVEDEELDVEKIVESSLFNEPEVEDITCAFRDESQLDFEVEDQHPSPISQAQDTSEPQILEVESQLTIADESIIEPQAPEEVLSQLTTTNEPISQSTNENSQLVDESEGGSLSLSIAVVSLVVISLSTAALLKLIKKRKNETLTVKSVSKNEPKVNENTPSSSLNGAVEVDMVGESCPSEYSSFQNTSSYNKNLKGNDEAQSIERRSKHKYKKVSHAASSDYAMTSSYGSFTTYYTISHSKEGDEEVVTPVRRSNRIRNKLTSPSQDSIASK